MKMHAENYLKTEERKNGFFAFQEDLRPMPPASNATVLMKKRKNGNNQDRKDEAINLI